MCLIRYWVTRLERLLSLAAFMRAYSTQVPDAKRFHCALGVCRGGLEDDLSIAEDKDVVALNFLRRAGKLSPAEQHGVWSDNFVRRHHTLCPRQYRRGCQPHEELADLVLADEGAGGCDETWWRDENGV